MTRKPAKPAKQPPKLKVVPLPAKKNVYEKHEPTSLSRTHVCVCAACGFTQEQIAAQLQISPPTLRKHYAWELENGKEQMIAKVAGNLFMTAMQRADLKASNTASIFLLKTRAGWRDVTPDEKAEGGNNVEVFLKIGDKEPKVA